MSNTAGSKKKKRHPVRNFFSALFLIAVLLLAALFGDFLPGLNGFRDGLLEKQAYTTQANDDTAKSAATAQDEIVIQEYDIYYMGEKVSLSQLGAKLDESGVSTVTLSDFQGTAKQKTWLDVSQLLAEKGLAVNENVIY